MHAHRLSLLFVAALLGACGGSRSMPGGATGGTGAGTGGDGAGGAPGSGGSSGGGGAGGSSGSASGGAGGGAGGGGGAGRGGSGAGDAAIDMPRADAIPEGGAVLDTAPLDSAEVGGGIDLDAGAASCGGATCPKLFPRIDVCKPAGACVQQLDGLMVRRCYANGVRILGLINPLAASIVGTYYVGSTQCYTAEAPLSSAPGQTVIFRDTVGGTEIGRAAQGPGTTTALTCDGQTFNLADRSCLPAFTESDCPPGICP
jgi:hypothetical protein